MRVNCSKCGGTGNQGISVPFRCRVCGGEGTLSLLGRQLALYEWVEGYLDPETETDWLERQIRKLMDCRDEFLAKKD